MGVAGGEMGARGQFGAYDAKTGKEVWKFWTVPGPGEFGHDTWEGESWQTGGAPVWTHPAIDPGLGTVYITTGNPWPVTDGTKRGGDNLFSASIVALDFKTGARKWHFQEVHHDLWDYDGPSPPVLADITYQGKPRKILMHGNKNGMMYILDRTNGTPLIGVDEKTVPQNAAQKTAKTQPYPIGDPLVPLCPEAAPDWFPSGCVFTPFHTERVAIAPGTNGGLAWAPTSYSPQTKLWYACGNVRANSFWVWGFGALPFTQVIGGVLSAIDPTTNKAVWSKKLSFQCGGGSGLLTTATGLLFHGQGDGLLVAYDATTGDRLWQFQTGAGADAPVATYEVAGEQYIAILAGGNQYMGTAFGDNLWAFKLGGTVAALPAPRPPATTVSPPAILQVAPALLATYAGTYEVQPNQNLTLVLDGGKLKLQSLGGPALEMYATSDTTFFTLTPNLQIQVVKDTQGTITHLGVRQGFPGRGNPGPEMKAVRK
jgi:PQQ-dependent dehydrogenase (methanol/ethanol family)